MTNTTKLAIYVAERAIHNEGGTINLATNDTPTGVYLVGGTLSMKIPNARDINRVDLTMQVKAWLDQHLYSIQLTGNVGFWWHGDVLYIDAVEAVYSHPVKQIEDAVRMIAQYRSELAFAYISYDGKYTEFKTINDLKNTRVYTV